MSESFERARKKQKEAGNSPEDTKEIIDPEEAYVDLCIKNNIPLHEKKKMLTEADLNQFSGTEKWYRHPLVRFVLYTDGVKYVAEEGGAYWLIDAIASYQNEPRIKKNERLQQFQLWELNVKDGSAILTCRPDSGEKAVVTQIIEHTDFPLVKIKFYVEPTGGPNGEHMSVILLPSEH